MTGIGIRHSERRRALLEGLREGNPRRVALAGDIGDQGAVIALIELRPVGVAQRIEGGERLIGLAGGLLHPGARQNRGQIGDRALARRGEMLVGLLIVALLEGLAAEQELRDAMRRLDLDQLARELDGAIPIRRRGLEQKGLLQDQLVAGILGERFGIVVSRRDGIVVAARHAPGEIVSEQSAGTVNVRYGRGHLRIGGGSGENGQGKERPPRPFAEDGSFSIWHVRSAWRRPKHCASELPPSEEDYVFSRSPQPIKLLTLKGGAFVTAARGMPAVGLTY